MGLIKMAIPNQFFCTYEMRTTDVDKIISDVKRLVFNHKVVKLSPGWHIENLRNFYNTLVPLLGDTVLLGEDWRQGGKRTGEQWMEIRYDESIPDKVAFRHSQNAQPLHTDESYKQDPSDLIIFYCQNKAENGGETIFVDGDALVKRMREIDPDLLKTISTQEITYEKAGSLRKSKIITLQENLPPLFNFNYFCIDRNESEENKKINREFFDFLETHVKGSYLEKAITLHPGEAVIWWDHAVLHGRRPFSVSKTDDRLIWKTAVTF
jgi:alpha-ketoglutarate-dependent taurine dioxygenase